MKMMINHQDLVVFRPIIFRQTHFLQRSGVLNSTTWLCAKIVYPMTSIGSCPQPRGLAAGKMSDLALGIQWEDGRDQLISGRDLENWGGWATNKTWPIWWGTWWELVGWNGGTSFWESVFSSAAKHGGFNPGVNQRQCGQRFFRRTKIYKWWVFQIYVNWLG